MIIPTLCQNAVTKFGPILQLRRSSIFFSPLQFNKSHLLVDTKRNNTTSQNEQNQMTLFQYNNCPFCCKVRSYLKFKNFSFQIVEVNPLTRKEISFSKYKKVPIIVINGKQINDSTVIVSLLESYLHTGYSFDDLVRNYSPIMDDKGKLIDYENKFEIVGITDHSSAERKKENHWRRWVSTNFIHRLAPNIYRNLPEAYEAMDYISDHGNFTPMQRFLAKNGGAIFMFALSGSLKKKHKITDARESLYSGAKEWLNSLDTHNFNGGILPNLSDMEMYGVLTAIHGLTAFNDLCANVPDIKDWYQLMDNQIES